MEQWTNAESQRHASLASLEGDLFGEHWNVLQSLYQAITMVDVGDGTTTSFCYNAWHNEDTHDECFPAIHSHCTRKNVSVEQVCASGTLDLNLFVPRLSNQDTSEFSQLQQIVIQTTLSDTRDKHSAKGNLTPAAFIVFCSPGMRHHTLLPSSSGIVMLLQESNSSFGYSSPCVTLQRLTIKPLPM